MLTLYDGTANKTVYEAKEHKARVPWKTVIHRGYCDGYPENTIASYYKCWEAGMDGYEIDTWVTVDNVIVCVHDETVTGVSATTGETVTITPKDCTLAEVKDLILATTEDFGNIYIPTLDEILTFSRYHNMYVFMDVKGKGAMDDATFYTQVAKQVVLHNMSELFSYRAPDANIENVKVIDPSGGVQETLVRSTDVTAEVMLSIRANGRKSFIHGGVSESLAMPYYPDFIQFNSVEIANSGNKAYLDSLRFFDNRLTE